MTGYEREEVEENFSCESSKIEFISCFCFVSGSHSSKCCFSSLPFKEVSDNKVSLELTPSSTREKPMLNLLKAWSTILETADLRIEFSNSSHCFFWMVPWRMKFGAAEGRN